MLITRQQNIDGIFTGRQGRLADKNLPNQTSKTETTGANKYKHPNEGETREEKKLLDYVKW